MRDSVKIDKRQTKFLEGKEKLSKGLNRIHIILHMLDYS